MSKMVEDDFDESALFATSVMPTAPSGNPLAAYFRLPGLSVKLPTGGVFFPEGGIDLDEAGEVGVLPMRAEDELLLSSPDALMNNMAVMNLIRSCVPAIKMPEHISVTDLDVLLIAIRVASCGETMDVEMECPKCKKATPFEINLPAVLSTMTTVPHVNPVRLNNEIVAYLRPHEVKVQTKIVMSAYKEARAAQALDAQELPDEEKAEKLAEVMKRLNAMHRFGLSQAIEKIVIPNAVVTQPEYIVEFLENTDKKTLDVLKDAQEKLNSLGIERTVPATCGHCSHEWAGTIEFNPATFFAARSSD